MASLSPTMPCGWCFQQRHQMHSLVLNGSQKTSNRERFSICETACGENNWRWSGKTWRSNKSLFGWILSRLRCGSWLLHAQWVWLRGLCWHRWILAGVQYTCSPRREDFEESHETCLLAEWYQRYYRGSPNSSSQLRDLEEQRIAICSYWRVAGGSHHEPKRRQVDQIFPRKSDLLNHKFARQWCPLRKSCWFIFHITFANDSMDKFKMMDLESPQSDVVAGGRIIHRFIAVDPWEAEQWSFQPCWCLMKNCPVDPRILRIVRIPTLTNQYNGM